ncbi:MAG TPA: TIM-barrel domain-containing protein [Bryobacteraceae bacterium]|nr:TIM-barrel domain-containing protein [Bryobacteraceae bacterium]
MICKRYLFALLVSTALPLVAADAANRPATLLSDVVDVSGDFHSYTNSFYLADTLASFDRATGSGVITWRHNQLSPRLAFNNIEPRLVPSGSLVFPDNEYATNPALPFSIQFVTPRTVRIRIHTSSQVAPASPSLMLAGEPPRDNSWKYERINGGHRFSSAAGSVTIYENPWRIEFRDAAGRLLTETNHSSDNGKVLDPVLPFSFIRRASDYSRSIAAVFTLSASEKLFGCGESFTRLDKRGQKLVLWTNDANGVENAHMYKPIPFFMSSRGYGMFVHTSAPATFDFGASFSGTTELLLGDDDLDLFVFLGAPKDILNEYTTLTGKAAMPPLWSFGLWMSRITYNSEDQVRDVAAKLRQNRIPADVIHIDTGWFETDWRCDYRFSTTRFKDPAQMMADLKRDGFHISLWQLPYFVPKNSLFPEILAKGLAVKDGKGNLPFEDAVLDFTNPATVAWYQEKIAGLLRMGVGAIKVDFGEAAPQMGVYANGRTGFYEHNLYPLRYNRAVAEITKQVTGENIIWARSAWAGSQRYPLHWGGDSGNDDTSMAATLRGGLSFGLSGFSFWSHDIGGFTQRSPEELYRRWMPFGMLTSHSRCHGAPPKEPWAYSPQFLDDFRRADEMKYRLMPYVYAQAKDSSGRGLPMVRALFIEYPEDPGAWLVEDEYLFGADILVAPLMEAGTSARDVYLPAGQWIDYQTGKTYSGGWHNIQAGQIPVVMLVRDGAVIPHMKVAQSTAQLDWSNLEMVVFGSSPRSARGVVCLPSDNLLRRVEAVWHVDAFTLTGDPLPGKTTATVRPYQQFVR